MNYFERLAVNDIMGEKSTVERLYALVEQATSEMQKPDCHLCWGFCCTRPPTPTVKEMAYLMRQEPKFRRAEGDEFCIFFDGSTTRKGLGCTVYEHRPLECRLYHVVDLQVRGGPTPCPPHVNGEFLGRVPAVLRHLFFSYLKLVEGSNALVHIRDYVNRFDKGEIGDRN